MPVMQDGLGVSPERSALGDLLAQQFGLPNDSLRSLILLVRQLAVAANHGAYVPAHVDLDLLAERPVNGGVFANRHGQFLRNQGAFAWQSPKSFSD